MTLKDKLPDRLKCSPLLTMESDSDIETIAESIVSLSDSEPHLPPRCRPAKGQRDPYHPRQPFL